MPVRKGERCEGDERERDVHHVRGSDIRARARLVGIGDELHEADEHAGPEQAPQDRERAVVEGHRVARVLCGRPHAHIPTRTTSR